VRQWARRYFGENAVLEINLEASPQYQRIFAGDLSADRLLDEINLLSNFNLRLPGRLLFIDEIQAFPRAITALRFFYEQFPQLAVVAAGSLIEFALDEYGTPVGRIEYLHVAPVTFSEFLTASGRSQLADLLPKFADMTQECREVPEAVHHEMLALTQLYMRIGGMPKAVSAYIDTRDIGQVAREQKLILQAYQEDFPKYAKRSQLETLHSLFTRLPHIVCLQRVQYRKVDPNVRNEKIKRSIELLQRAKLVSRITCSRSKLLPLSAEEKPEFFKLLHLDIGLLQHSLGFNWEDVNPESDLSSVCNGRFAEQFVGQEILANRSGLSLYQLHYWDRGEAGAEAELDFLVECNQSVLPVEVKSGQQGSLRSLHAYIQDVCPNMALVLSQRNAAQLQSIRWLPLYLAGYLNR
jgi:predicted AAA+ superfamily ATPase